MAGTGALRILLTGAAGLVGQGVALACQRSPQVSGLTALVRHPGSLSGAGSELIVPDFLRIQDRSDELAGFDACFYCAGAPPVGKPERKPRSAASLLSRCSLRAKKEFRADNGSTVPILSSRAVSRQRHHWLE